MANSAYVATACADQSLAGASVVAALFFLLMLTALGNLLKTQYPLCVSSSLLPPFVHDQAPSNWALTSDTLAFAMDVEQDTRTFTFNYFLSALGTLCSPSLAYVRPACSLVCSC